MMSHKNTKNQVRIIGGKWRSRKLYFMDAPGLRPTPNRVRETLFNWLTPHIIGAHCLDLFAGSGALGFEALSRGAASVLLVDRSLPVITQLQHQVMLFHAEKEAQCICTQIPNDKILTEQSPFDIVFLDPPFHQHALITCCQWLVKNVCLSKEAFIYIEAESSLDLKSILPKHWKIHRNQTAGQVGYYLIIAHGVSKGGEFV